jgi:cytochrome P450
MGNRFAENQLRNIWEEIMKRFRTIEVVGQETRLKSNFIRGIRSMPVQVKRW